MKKKNMGLKNYFYNMNNKMTQVESIMSILKSCLDLMRNDASHLNGNEAFPELANFLIIKSIEKHIDNENINIYNLELYGDTVNKYGKEKFLEMIECVKFSKFVEYAKKKEKINNIKNLYENFLMKEILSKLPKLKTIFQNRTKTLIKSSDTIRKILLTLDKVNFENYSYDILGEAYEKIFVSTIFGGGKNIKNEMGQFFTPTNVKEMLVNLVNPQIKEDGTIESVFDPSSGTGGILNTTIKHYQKLANEGKISNEDLNEELKKKIYGIEIKDNIYKLCVSNMLIGTGNILENVICDDSIRKYHSFKVDNIIANPPFSVNIKYDDLKLGEKIKDYLPIKVGGKNSEMLFLQMMIHCLNINGKCCTVMLNGSKMTGTTSGNNKVREYLLRSCELHEVIACPSKTFTSTSSLTCILFFTKKLEREEVLEVKIKGKRREYRFSDKMMTKTVKFYNFNPETNEKIFDKEISIEKIIENDYSLNLGSYIKRDELNYSNDIEVKTLGEVCEVKIGGTPSRKNTIYFENGNNLWVSIKDLKGKYINNTIEKITDSAISNSNVKKLEKNTILFSFKLSIGKTAIAGKELYTNEAIAGINTKNKTKLLNEYLYYYLTLKNFNDFGNGCIGNGSLNKKKVLLLKIPIPPLEIQQKIIDFLDNLQREGYDILHFTEYYVDYDIFKYLLEQNFEVFEDLVKWAHIEKRNIYEIERLNEKNKVFLNLTSKKFDRKTLGEVCDLKNGKQLNKKDIIKGNIPVFGGGFKIVGFHNTHNRNGNETIICGTGTYSGYVNHNYGKPFWASQCFTMKSKNINIMIDKYLYYYSKIILEQQFMSNQKGSSIPFIRSKQVVNVKIPIPPLEIQQKIIDYCDNNNKRIKELKMENIENKNNLKFFF